MDDTTDVQTLQEFSYFSHVKTQTVQIADGKLLKAITGQNKLNYIPSKIPPGVIIEQCRFCEEEDETFAHLLMECTCFISYRQEVL